MTIEQFEALEQAQSPPQGAVGYPFMPEDEGALHRIASELAWRGLVPIARGESQGLAIVYGAVA